jgi:MFS transporter, PPP family, 3-phenylpropionic acid transporter
MDKKTASKFKSYYFFKFIGQGVLYPFLVLFLTNKGITGSLLGLLLMILPLGKVVLLPIIGYACDLYRVHKLVLITSVVLNATGALLLAFSPPTFSYLFLAIILITLGEASSDTLINTLSIDFLSRSNNQTHFGKWRLWGAIGFMTGSFSLGLFQFDLIIKIIPLLFAGANIFAFFLAFFLPKTSSTKPTDWLGGVKIITQNKSYALLLFGMVITGVAFSNIISFYTVYMNGIGAASWMLGTGVALQTLIEIILSANTKKIADKFPLRIIYLFGFIILPIRSFLYLINRTPIIGLLIQNLHGFFIFSAFIIGLIVLDKNLAPEWRSSGQSFYTSAIGGIGALLGSFLSPIIFDNYGMDMIWIFTTFCALIGFLLVSKASKVLAGNKKF